MSERFKRNYLKMLVFSPIAILLLLFMQIFFVTRFNERKYTVKGTDDTQPTYMALDPREDSTSTWLKRDFYWKGKTYDLNAQTIDGVLHNNSGDIMNSWSLRIDILEDCFMNNAWCGTVEIHQYVGTDEEETQLLDLRNYDLNDVKLAYQYDGDLLIPLTKGDYVIYYPSAKDSEIPVEADSEMTIGVIFYYFDDLEFLDHELDFTYHRTFTYGKLFGFIFALSAIWVIAAGQYLITSQIYKDAQRKMEDKKSGLLCMSEIYFAIYIVELDHDRMIPVIEKRTDMIERPANAGAGEMITRLFEADAEDVYKELVKEFCDLSTLPDRLNDRNSIVCEYISRQFGWCSLRFFVMDRIEERPIDRVLMTIQIIDAEKREMDVFEQRISKAENEKRMHSAFLEAVSDEVLQPAKQILEYDRMLLRENVPDAAYEYAKQIGWYGRKLVTLMDHLVEYTRLEARPEAVKKAPFLVSALVEDIRTTASELSEKSEAEINYDIARNLPESAAGDVDNIRRVMTVLIENALKRTAAGTITISIFGRQFEDRTHLLFSVRDTGEGSDASDGSDIGVKLASGIAAHMGAPLQIIHTTGVGNEAYFEIDA
ncbi:MAG: hypothetical protein IJT32_05030 [Lachnospiraceae bacterium]|nr:hypothetical protein [Lachnospiraceae bacterium]